MKPTLWREAQLVFWNTFHSIINTFKKLSSKYPETTGAQSLNTALPVSAVLGIRRSAQVDLRSGQMTCPEDTWYTQILGASATVATWLASFVET